MRGDWQGKTSAANSDHNPAALERMGHHPTFAEGVPILNHVTTDALEDAHLTIFDPATRTAWGMWGAQKRDDDTSRRSLPPGLRCNFPSS